MGVAARDDAGDGSGAIYLLNTATGGGSLATAGAILWGEDDGCALGAALANGGDVDGDGLDDLLAGEPGCEAGDPETGTALLLRGPFSGGAEVVDHAVRWRGESRADQAGVALSTLGDVDGDGRADLLVGGPGSDEAASGGGLVWMLYGVGL